MPLLETADVEKVAAFVDEAIDEAIGTSHKKWALIVVALIIGAAGALWFTRRGRSLESGMTPSGGGSSS